MEASLTKKHFIFFLFTLSLFFSFLASAQKVEPIMSNQGNIVTLHSEILKEDRRIMIYAPKDSANLNLAYPVIYVLDAENHYNLLVELSKFFGRADVEVAPPMIVVGITNTDRNRDLTPSHSSFDSSGNLDTVAFKNTGGNESFLRFIRQELIPYVNFNYKIKPYRIFAGHSFGGSTAINCLINYPDMFNAYIAISPALWWDHDYILKLADETLKSGSTLSKTFFLSNGDEGRYNKAAFHNTFLTLDSLLEKRSLQGLDYKFIHYPMEDHNTVPIKSYYDGLRFIYRQWGFSPLSYKEDNFDNLMKHYKLLSEKFGYTILPEESNINEWGEWLVASSANVSFGLKLLKMNTINYPSSSKAFAALGEGYSNVGDKQKAIEAYKKAGELNPESREIRTQLRELQK
ncbi:alpha/beta hydrolase-fold protein [Arcticibacter eurypsychrophilus]|uniref:alpha/beta hydrolase-fold protein n=1 Tax=Arcticibacter eurypsychrophilus TaxID=1434752 RepID=UPI00084D9AA0|nr:alpha/beta hydrolase-fold protein [Arcticibacter eurypsychrophilus]